MKKILLLVGSGLLTAYGLNAQNFQKSLSREFRRILGRDFKEANFKFRQVPFDNFGVLTAYKDNVEFANFQCASFDCINESIPQNDFQKWLSVDGFAEVGASHSTVQLSKTIQNDFALNMALPKLFSILGINFDAKSKKVKNIKLDLGNFYLRLLKPIKLSNYLLNRPSNDQLKSLWDKGDLVFIGGDIVVEYIDLIIDVDQDLATKLDAKIDTSAVTIKSLDNSNYKFSTERTVKGTYHFKVNSPVIIAYMPRKQSGAGVLSALKKNMTMSEISAYWDKYSIPYNLQLKKAK
jgi:hypothetical protein